MHKHRLEVVKRALRHWDPIGVITNEKPDCPAFDEYDSYAPRILALLEAGASGRDVALRLASIRVDAMTIGVRSPTDRENAIGEKLSHWRDERFHVEPEF